MQCSPKVEARVHAAGHLRSLSKDAPEILLRVVIHAGVPAAIESFCNVQEAQSETYSFIGAKSGSQI